MSSWMPFVILVNYDYQGNKSRVISVCYSYSLTIFISPYPKDRVSRLDLHVETTQRINFVSTITSKTKSRHQKKRWCGQYNIVNPAHTFIIKSTKFGLDVFLVGRLAHIRFCPNSEIWNLGDSIRVSICIAFGTNAVNAIIPNTLDGLFTHLEHTLAIIGIICSMSCNVKGQGNRLVVV